jgi:hypothetical protein
VESPSHCVACPSASERRKKNTGKNAGADTHTVFN